MKGENIIGVDVGGTKCAITYGKVSDAHIHILDKVSFQTTGCAETISEIKKTILEVLVRNNLRKSDIYSIGILMYELVVGRVPFKGDSPVEVAIKHMKTPLPSITDAYPEIPQSIENVILKACAKNPQNRYKTVQDMHDDLLTVLDKERFNEPKVKYLYNEDEIDDDMPREKRSDRNKLKEEKRKNKKMNKALIIIGAIILALALVMTFIMFIYPRFFKAEVEVPDVTDMTVSQAEDVLKEKDLKFIYLMDKIIINEKKETSKILKTLPKDLKDNCLFDDIATKIAKKGEE